MTKAQEAIMASMLGMERELPAVWNQPVERAEFEEKVQRLEEKIAWLEQALTDLGAEQAVVLDQVFCMAAESSLDTQGLKRQIGETRIQLHRG